MKIFDQKPSIIRFIGDVHGMYSKYNKLIQCEYPTIQVGDFGVGFVDIPDYPPPPPELPPEYQAKDWFIRGNHDNPAACKENAHWIPDGYVEHDIMFIGGARSTDIIKRFKNFDWWEDEELSETEFESIVDTAVTRRPKIIVSHDAPSKITDQMFYTSGTTLTSRVLDVVYKLAPPSLWVFGHYHRSIKTKIDNTLFICCNIDEAVDIDISKLLGEKNA